jgi:hypothetical protein
MVERFLHVSASIERRRHVAAAIDEVSPTLDPKVRLVEFLDGNCRPQAARRDPRATTRDLGMRDATAPG